MVTKTQKKKKISDTFNLDKAADIIPSSILNSSIKDFSKILEKYSIPSFENESEITELISDLKTKSQKRNLKIRKKSIIF